MRICELSIDGFRGVQKAHQTFPPHAVLLGANNVGKSTIAEAIAILSGREGLTKPLCDWDFSGGMPTAASRFTIVATVTDFAGPDQTDPTRFPSWFVDGATPVWWNDDKSQTFTDTDPPAGTQLAARIAVSGRYDEETCDFEVVRFFFDGPCDPFNDQTRRVSNKLLRDLGIFFLPSQRQWDRLLAFGSSTFMKVLREYDAIPAAGIEALKRELRSSVTKLEGISPLSDILKDAEDHLRSFLMLTEAGSLVYRPTSLDTLSVLRSIMPHAAHSADLLVPVERSGSGFISLQSFLLLLAFSQRRVKSGRNFILVADEPELHLHPSLHRRLVHRIRAASSQSIVMTQSPGVAAGYQPTEVIFLQNAGRELTSTRLRTAPVPLTERNAIKKLYLDNRQELYDALMGSVVIVPEGKWDWKWLLLWQRVAEASPQSMKFCPVSLVPTSDGAVVETLSEIQRLRPDALPIVDGDTPGDNYVTQLCQLPTPPRRIVRLGMNAGIECLTAWVLEPGLSNPTGALAGLLPDPKKRSLKDVQSAIIAVKDKAEFHESLAWEASETPACIERVVQWFEDITAIALGTVPSPTRWQMTTPTGNTTMQTALHIKRA